MRRKITIILCFIFFLAMAILSFTARSIHNMTLPKVTVGYLRNENFIENNVNNMGLAIPKEMYDSNQNIYVIRREIVNGEERNIARMAKLRIGSSNEEYYEVKQGISILDLVILSGGEMIRDGMEVYVESISNE